MDSDKQDNGLKQGKGLMVLCAFFLGGLVGSILGLLFAPMTGRETRERIRDASTDLKERTINTVHRSKNATTEKVTDLVGKGRAQVDGVTENARTAVEAGKTAFVEKKSELANITHDKDEEAAEADAAEADTEETAS